MTVLVVSGDSWTSCWPLEERLGHRRFGWPNLVSNHFGYELVDKSRAGSSNYRIYRKAFDSIVSSQANIVIVFLTHWTRFETGSTYGDKPGRIYQHLPSYNTSTQAFKLFFHPYKAYTDILRQIISLQNLAKNYHVPCFFLDTFDNNITLDITKDDFKKILRYNMDVFDNMDDARIDNKFSIVETLCRQIDLTSFISRDSYNTLVKGCKLDQNHPVEDGHRQIANVVINFLESKNYGQTI